MRKIMMALPCLLFCGFVAAKEAPSLDMHGGADSLLLAKAFNATRTERAPVGNSGTLEAANKKKPMAKSAPKAAAAPTTTLAPDSKRFNMTQGGKRMTADDFDAWMKKNGYHVATGTPGKSAEEPSKGSK